MFSKNCSKSNMADENVKCYSHFGKLSVFLIKLNITLFYDPAVALFGIYPWKLLFPQKPICECLRGFVHSHQNLETPSVSLRWWQGTQAVVLPSTDGALPGTQRKHTDYEYIQQGWDSNTCANWEDKLKGLHIIWFHLPDILEQVKQW